MIAISTASLFISACIKKEFWGCPGVPVHGGIPIVFISIHGVVTQFVNVSFLCVPVHEDTTGILALYGVHTDTYLNKTKTNTVIVIT